MLKSNTNLFYFKPNLGFCHPTYIHCHSATNVQSLGIKRL